MLSVFEGLRNIHLLGLDFVQLMHFLQKISIFRHAFLINQKNLQTFNADLHQQIEIQRSIFW